MSSPPKSRTKSWAASQSFDSLSSTGQSSRHKRLQALTRPGKGTSTHHRDRTHRSSRVTSERNNDDDEGDGAGSGGNCAGSGRLRVLSVALAISVGFLMCIGLFQLVVRGFVAKLAVSTIPIPTMAPTPTPTIDTWAPPAIVIVLREASSQQVTATHGAHLLHATVHRALAASPRSKVAILHNAPAHMGHGEPLERLAKDFAPSVELFSAVIRDASPRQAFVSRHCNRARYNHYDQEGHSYTSGLKQTSTGSLCASQAFRRLLTAADFLDSHSEEWTPAAKSAVLVLEPGTLLFFGEEHLKKLALRLPMRKGVLTSLEGLNYDLKLGNSESNNSSSSSSSSSNDRRSLSGKCGVDFDPALQAATKHPHTRKAADTAAGTVPKPELMPMPFDVGAPAILATLEGLHGVLGAATRALVRDLALTEPAGASWWLEPPTWFDPEHHPTNAAANPAVVVSTSTGVGFGAGFTTGGPSKNEAGTTTDRRAQKQELVSAFSGDAWAQFLSDVPDTAQLPHTLDLVADSVSRRCPGLHRHTNASIHLSSSAHLQVDTRTTTTTTASTVDVESAAAAAARHLLPGDLTERRWRRFLGFFERQLSSGPLLRKASSHGSSSHTRKEWVTKTPDGKRVEHVKLVKTVHRRRPLPDPQLALNALDGALKWSCSLAMVHPEQLALSSSSSPSPQMAVDGSGGSLLTTSAGSSDSNNNSSNPSRSQKADNCKPGLLPALSCLPLIAATKDETPEGTALELAPDALQRAWLVPIAALPLSRALVASAQGAALWHEHGTTSNTHNPQLHKSHHRQHHLHHNYQQRHSFQHNDHLEEGTAESVERAAHGLEFGILTDQFTLPKKGKWGKAIRTRPSETVAAADVEQDTAAILSQFMDYDC